MDNISIIAISVYSASILASAIIGRHKDRMSEGILFGIALGPVAVPITALLKSRRSQAHPLERRLDELSRLHASGTLTDEEYQEKRRQAVADF